ncbi:hypothetical protein MCOR33_007771 [Pyricularia grisea]|uniref:Inositol polyphosphate-related phosphatase domain-containing protein n=1 Tax=Pyricularia grisea TaxID=148305 RepID=A0ABQ8NDK3_PYRGI|nr:hypothetical protein MCOR33_007771 [Pyricularia grisea]
MSGKTTVKKATHGLDEISVQHPKMMGGNKKKLDLLILSFNAAKKMVDSSVFAHHLETTLVTNATSLPEVVVFSLQEISPLSYAFIGGPLLAPFLSRYEEALNIAAVKIKSTPSTPATPASASAEDERDDVASPASPGVEEEEEEQQQQQSPLLGPLWRKSRRAPGPYTLVKQHNVGMTAIMLFALHPSTISSVELAEVGFGTLDMGNKGAVAIRCIFTPPGGGSSSSAGDGSFTQLTLVATHLAPMEWNLKRRHANWQSICSALLFGDPVATIKEVARPEDQDVVSGLLRRRSTGRVSDSAASPAPTAEEEAEAEALLREAEEQDRVLAGHMREALRDMTIFRPGSHVFVAGDLNYRTADKSPKKEDRFPSFDPDSPDHWPTLLERDQLSKEKAAGKVLRCFTEEDIAFPPTYKYDVLHSAEGAINEAEAREAMERGDADLVVPYRFAKHRWPSWTDRVLYMQVPEFAKTEHDGQGEDHTFAARAYTSMPLMRSSDHQPVFLRLDVPILTPTELGREVAKAKGVAGQVLDSSREDGKAGAGTTTTTAAAARGKDGSAAGDSAPQDQDVRISLPYPLDIHATARRQVARSREFMSGWTMLLWCTKEGAAALGSLAVLALGTYWLYQVL